jgi:two-component system chemotaxis response regulator CheB
MTGMGSDGKKGLQLLKLKGGTVVSQDEESSIVYGMPRAVVEAGIADEIVSLDDIYNRIVFHCR